MIGLGKLGLPCAVAMSMRGHDVMGVDLDANRMTKNPQPYLEAGPDGTGDFNDHLAASRVRFGQLQEVVDHAEILFIAVQTPHDPLYEGVTRLPEERVDFDYRYLMAAVADTSMAIGNKARRLGTKMRETVVVIISTVLPGTMREKIRPLCNHWMRLCYNPYFIAMGTTMRDFLNPEFVLFGTPDGVATEIGQMFYEQVYHPREVPFVATSVENAELIKVAYNTFIGMKISFANTLMEICHKSPGCNVDEVTDALKLGGVRLISPAYLSGGMGDGGGCHPRDNIALSWLSRKLNLSYDWFENLMLQRERSTEWLAHLVAEQHQMEKLPVVILGTAFKPGTNLEVGSPALLLKNILEHDYDIEVETWDPYVDEATFSPKRAVYFIGTKHPCWQTVEFPAKSVVIDPWRYIEPQLGVRRIPIGVG